MLTIYKNRESGNHFIFVKEIDADTGLFITPQGKDKPLKFKFFQEDSFEYDEKNLLNNPIFTPEQVIKYEQYNEYRDDEDRGNFIDDVIEFAQQEGKSLKDLLGSIDEMEKENKNDKLLIKFRERILDEL